MLYFLLHYTYLITLDSSYLEYYMQHLTSDANKVVDEHDIVYSSTSLLRARFGAELLRPPGGALRPQRCRSGHLSPELCEDLICVQPQTHTL